MHRKQFLWVWFANRSQAEHTRDESTTKLQAIHRERVERLSLIGKVLEVHYPDGDLPFVSLRRSQIERSHSWLLLPDTGVFLPNGRPVIVEVRLGGGPPLRDSDIRRLKEQLRREFGLTGDENVVDLIWDNWETPSRKVPDFLTEDVQIPFEENTYGQHPLTGEQLNSWGTLGFDTETGRFHWVWLRNRQEAERIQAQSQRKLEFIRAEAEIDPGRKT